MRVMPFFQVFFLLTLLVYLLLVALENPGLVRLPLPFGQGEWLLSTGWTVALFALLGGTYVLFLFLPVALRLWSRQRLALRERRALEDRFVATLGARLGTGAADSPESGEEPKAAKA